MKVLVYHLSDIENHQKIKSILKMMNISLEEIDDSLIHNKIKDLISHKGRKRKNKRKEMPMLVFVAMTSSQIDTLLNAFQSNNIPFIPLKAMVTASNINWSFEQLYDHIYKEYKQVTNLR